MPKHLREKQADGWNTIYKTKVGAEHLAKSISCLACESISLVHLFHGVHQWGAWALAGLIGLHAAAGLFHGLVLRDGVFQSMWPYNRRKADA